MLGKVGSAILRTLQLIFAAAVLGLSINAVKWQYYNSVPATNGYGVFVGIFGCLAALLGSIAICSDSFVSYITVVGDWLATIFFLAGGIAMAIGLHGANCSDGNPFRVWHNKLISGGCVLRTNIDRYQCGFFHISDLEHRCRLAKADMAFLWLGMVASLGAAVLSMHHARKKKKNGSSAV